MLDVLGHCAECGRLITIVPRGLHPGTRNQRWHPVYHPKQSDDSGGPPCPGVEKAL